jgi:hypothetical protein
VPGLLLARGVDTPPPHLARRDLQTATFNLGEPYATAVGGSTGQRRAAEQCWPAVSAAQNLAYCVLSTCWMFEQDGTTPEPLPKLPRFLEQVVSTLSDSLPLIPSTTDGTSTGGVAYGAA